MSLSGGKLEQRSKLELRGSTLTLPSIFHFWNGDEYEGGFGIHPEKQRIVMEGKGEYRTSDGHTYEGFWSDDCLVEDCKITFPDKSIFTGFLENMVMEGPGKYKFKEEVVIEGELLNNRFIGKVFLRDPNGHIWQSVSDEGDVQMFFRPLHPHWQSLLHRSSQVNELFLGEACEE